MIGTRRGFLLAAGAALLPWPAVAQAGHPAATVIAAFYATLREAMEKGPALGFQGRYALIEPVLRRSFDVAEMCRLAVGLRFAKLPPEKQAALVDTFARYMIATYADRFDAFSGEKFAVGATRALADGNVLVETELTPAKGEKVALNYRMRGQGEAWRVVDVYLSGSISEIVRLRADFSSTLAQGGADALIAALEEKIASMRAGG